MRIRTVSYRPLYLKLRWSPRSLVQELWSSRGDEGIKWLPNFNERSPFDLFAKSRIEVKISRLWRVGERGRRPEEKQRISVNARNVLLKCSHLLRCFRLRYIRPEANGIGGKEVTVLWAEKPLKFRTADRLSQCRIRPTLDRFFERLRAP